MKRLSFLRCRLLHEWVTVDAQVRGYFSVAEYTCSCGRRHYQ